jgi:hypothetical protein
MSKIEWKTLVGVVGRLLLAFAFVFSQTAWAGQNAQTKDKADSLQKAAASQTGEKQSSVPTTDVQGKQAESEESESAVTEKPSHDGSHEGIKVHGHWTIEVRNPDGAVVTHREFENSLVANSGSTVMANILACFTAGNCPNQTNVLVWEVDLAGNPQPCSIPPDPITGIGGPHSCLLQGPAPNFPNYTLTAAAQGTSFVLQGTVVATENGNISQVTTVLPGSGPLTGNFTSRTLDGQNGNPQAVPVSSGQTVSVTVNISFS